jgi:hypothetical protein
MWYDYNLILSFRKELINKGYISKQLLFLDGILFQLEKNIRTESFDVMNDLLRKTYYRLLENIDKGSSFLPEIINNPRDWFLIPLEKYDIAWIKNDVLIFTTESKRAVFSKEYVDGGFKYEDNKWQ